MNLVFLTDNPHAFRIAKDTSFALMLAADRLGHSVFIVERGGISASQVGVNFFCRPVKVRDNLENPFTFSSHITLPESEVHCVFIRTDPPFNEAYLTDTWLLSLLSKSIPVINSPAGIREANEKIWAVQFPKIIPHTILTARISEFQQFLREQKAVIIKPANGFGGSSVFLCRENDKNANVMFETVQKLSGYVIVQEYIESARKGDKRILLLGGEPLGAILRVHADHDHRNNFMAGGKACPAEITRKDMEIISTLKPHLQKWGLHLTGIDIIGDKLIEVNVTSPTCIREMEAEYKKDLSGQVIEYALKLRET